MRVRTPTILQIEAVECGAAALAIILAYYGKVVPLVELRQICGITHNGSQASNMILSARHYGMRADGYRMEINSLRQQAPPFIVFWNFNHFLVVEGFSKNKVFLNDPATGPRWVSGAEFAQGFTGVVLNIRPEPEFKVGGAIFSPKTAILSWLRGSFGGVFYCLLVGLLLAIPGVALPILIQLLVDWGLVKAETHWLRPLILGLILVAGLQGMLLLLQLRMLRRLRVKLTLEMASAFVKQLLALPVGFYSQRFTGEISDRLRLNAAVAQTLSGSVSLAMIEVTAVVIYILVMVTFDPLLTLVAVSSVIVNLLTLNWALHQSKNTTIRFAQAKSQVAAVGISGLQNLETLKASGMESEFFSHWAGHWTKVVNAEQDLEVPNQILNILALLLQTLTVALILGIGGLRVMEGSLTLGMLVAFQSLVQSIQRPASSLIRSLKVLQDCIAHLVQLDEVFSYPLDQNLDENQPAPDRNSRTHKVPDLPLTVQNGADELSNSGARSVPVSSPIFSGFGDWSPDYYPVNFLQEKRLRGFIELQGVTFGYTQVAAPLIQQVTFSVQPGQLIGVIGPNGSGKSTLAKLICGLYQPWSGEILFDQQPRAEIDRHILATSLVLAEQRPTLFEGSVRENLTLWDPTIQDAQLVQACQDAGIHQAILGIPGAYDGYVMEGGVNFSGSQRQQLEIARALVNNPTILIMDEAMNALDGYTQETILDNIRRRECTCILITHGLNSLKDCDEIFVLSQGKVVEQGTPKQLQQEAGIYQNLMNLKSDHQPKHQPQTT
ncbi:MAG: NHLP family bacteriocin export ABC transporter peptidase/permease/ATPase subunit [Oscillatoriales cyanobacterium RM2_1_1]|nr:NHLP family bacteriocin export ABC transporter peptidase/permease/ATPase subunit [Oscillatoriales cyanobacterium SM2_3_0]NJO45643.1 NHLP family bacteriocin export ABC transporter peptidase/permease/ATPase subunit [Oscillatoriales cyanobacterium RM2_1_1]